MSSYAGWQVAPKFVAPKPNKPKRTRPTRPRPVRPTRPRVIDPLAPLSDAELRARAQGLVQGQMGPLIQAVRDAIEARSRSGQQAIVGATNQLGGLFSQAGPATAQAYSGARSEIGADNSALANRLNSFGQNLGSEVTSKLQQISAPAGVVSEIGGGAASTAQGVSNANFAKGSASLDRLSADSAAGQAYAAKLPAIAGLTGLQHSRDLQAQLNRELADKVGSLSADGQQMFVSLYTHYLDNEWQKTLARTSGQFNSQKLELDAKYKAQLFAYKKADLAYRQGKAAADRAEKAREADQRAQTSRQNARRTQRGQNQRQNKWQTNPDGSFKYRVNKITGKKERIPIKPAKGSGSNSGL